jgi:hypothetical protein
MFHRHGNPTGDDREDIGRPRKNLLIDGRRRTSKNGWPKIVGSSSGVVGSRRMWGFSAK